ncbi:hypothetical protein [Bradyrhizobium sp. CW1]|nr:hypothetical protein [Bradyrhizobium sp. CW1]UPJ29276.1 hypothetical protein IVB54_09735 [Bradyrhizobium sp. CW1]
MELPFIGAADLLEFDRTTPVRALRDLLAAIGGRVIDGTPLLRPGYDQ